MCFISTFYPFFWFSNVILSDALILPLSQLQTQQVMTSQIRSHIQYLIPVYNSNLHIPVLSMHNFTTLHCCNKVYLQDGGGNLADFITFTPHIHDE